MAALQLSKLVEELRAVAIKYPQEMHVALGINTIVKPECNRTVTVGGKKFDVTFSYNVYHDGGIAGWQLSIIGQENEPPSDDTCVMLANAFLGEGYIELSFPDTLLATLDRSLQQHIKSRRQRQFVRRA